jgi:hydroxyacylglutathione hydrolase
MLFERIESSGLAQYSYLIGDKTNAVVIDPRRDCDIYIEKATEAGMVITDVLETHRHEDFAVGSVELAARTGAAIWHADNQLPYRYGRPVEAGQNWVVGNLRLEALHTPGHTEGSRSYVLYEPSGEPWMVFTGDVLFTGEVGRVDFLGMDRAPEMAGHLYASIFEKLLPLGDGVLLQPGHGYGSACGSTIADRPRSTLGLERKLNPRLQHTERDTFIHSVARELPKPLYFDRMETINLEGPPLLGNSPVPAPLTPNTFQEMIRDAYVIDVRGTEAFCASHVPGSFAMSLPTIPNSIGWFVPYDRPLLLVMDGASVLNAFPYLVRQGYDSVKGYLSGGMCGWAAGGYHTDSVDLLSPRDLLNQKDDWWILDVRSAGELAAGKIPGAHHIWMKHLNERVDDVPKDQPVVVYCGNGPRSLVAASVIQRSGCKHVGLLNGGIMAWCALRLPLA